MLRPRIIFNNLGLKIIAGIFAIAFWIYIQGELGVDFSRYKYRVLHEIKEIKKIPIEILISFDNLLEASVNPSAINIRFRGKEKDLDSILASDILVYVDLRGLTNPGVYKLPVQMDNELQDVSLVDALPLVEVTLEQEISAPMSVIPKDHNESKNALLGI